MSTNKQNSLSKEIEDFATELYDYIWTQHTFKSPSLEKEFTDKLSLIFDKPREISSFDDYIGKAVHCTQYLLRNFCHYKFKEYGCDLIESDVMFCVCVFDAIWFWIQYRHNIFLKIIDSAAIIAEAILFCDAELKVPIKLYKASFVFKIFFKLLLQKEFFARGGWSGLKAKALQDYFSLYLNLIIFLPFGNHEYVKLNHSCFLIDALRKSRVPFPIDILITCQNCKIPSDIIHSGFMDETKSIYEALKNVFTNNCIFKCDHLLQNMNVIKRDLDRALERGPRYSESEKQSGDVRKKGNFEFILLGKEDQGEISEATKCKKHIRTRRRKPNPLKEVAKKSKEPIVQ